MKNALSFQSKNGRVRYKLHAFHAKLMQPVSERLAKLAAKLKLNHPKIPYISNVTGTWIKASEATDPSYWAGHLCNMVRFSEGIGELCAQSNYALLEVGPGQTLTTIAIQHAKDSANLQCFALPSIRPEYNTRPDVAFSLSTLGQLWLAGAKVDWSAFYAHEKRRRLPLPTYPFERRRYWIEPRPAIGGVVSQSAAAWLGGDEDVNGNTAPSEPYSRGMLNNSYVPPSNDVERRIAKIWRELLGIEAIGIHDNFFRLGGDSMLGMRLVLRLRQVFQVDLPVRTLIESPTVADLAVAIEDALITAIEKLDENGI